MKYRLYYRCPTKSCRRIYYGLTAEEESNLRDQQGQSCLYCGANYKDFLAAIPTDVPRGATLQGIKVPSKEVKEEAQRAHDLVYWAKKQ